MGPWAKNSRWGHLGDFGSSYGFLGTVLGPSWGRLGASWGCLRTVLGPSWAVLEAFGAVLGRLGAVLERSWGQLGFFYRFLSDLPSENRSPNLEKSLDSIGKVIFFSVQAVLT